MDQAKRAKRPSTTERAPPAETARVEAEPACEVTAPLELVVAVAWLASSKVWFAMPRSMMALKGQIGVRSKRRTGPATVLASVIVEPLF